MKKGRKRFGFIVFITVIGFLATACPTDDGNDGSDFTGDTALNGTWVSTENKQELRFNNGNLESWEDGIIHFKGTYTTSDNMCSSTITHINGDYYRIRFGSGLESKWYSITELYTALVSLNEKIRTFYAIASVKVRYSISGNILTLGGATYTRK